MEGTEKKGWDGGPSTLLASCLFICRSGCGISFSDPCVCQPPADLVCCLCQRLPDPRGRGNLARKLSQHACCAVVESCVRRVLRRFDLNVKSNFSIRRRWPVEGVCLTAVRGHASTVWRVELGAGFLSVLSSFSFLMPLRTYVYKPFVLFRILYS